MSPAKTRSSRSSLDKSSSSSSTSEWRKCPQTGLLFHASDLAEHQRWLENRDAERQTYVVVAAGADTKSIMGEVTSVRRRDLLPARWQKLPPELLSRCLFMSEALMAASGVYFGDLVRLNGPNVLLQVFPHKVKELSNKIVAAPDAVLSICGAKQQLAARVRLTPFHQETGHLSHLRLRCDDVDVRGNDHLVPIFSRCFEGHTVAEGSPLLVPFYGRNVRLTVIGLTLAAAGDLSVAQLASDFKDISLLNTSAVDLIFTPADLTSSTPTRRTNNGQEVDWGVITSQTEVVIDTLGAADVGAVGRRVCSIGGLDDEIAKLRSSLKYLKGDRTRVGMKPVSGVLLWGPSGTGKTLLGKAVAGLLGVNRIVLSACELFSKFYGETEENLRSLFKEAKAKQPCIIFVDELDTMCPQRGQQGKSDQERRVLSALVSLMDDINESGMSIAIVAATSRIDAIDDTLRRPGRLDLEIEIGVPTQKQRRAILDRLLQDSGVVGLSESDVAAIAEATHGFVGADLHALISEAAADKVQMSLNDLERALTTVRPSAMREVQIEVPNVRWDDIGGLDELKLALKQAVEWPLKRPEAFERFGITPPKGVLMYGPPGCSKTMIAKALANESGLNFLAIKGPELFSKWVGESERAVRELFRKAKQVSPAIIFFDEVDALGSERGGGGSGKVGDRVLAQMLTEMDGIEQLKDVVIVAATNRPDMCDKALLRPGRLDRLFYVPLPDEHTRRKVFEVHTKNKPVGHDVNMDSLVARTSGYSGAEVAAVCNEAALKALEEDIESVGIAARHFDLALQVVTPRINLDLLEVYSKFQSQK